MAEDTDILGASIVLVGKFNPAIFSPAWFAYNDVITGDELKAAETEVIHPQISKFTIDHLSIGAQRERFSISVSSDPIIKIVDIALLVFGKLLPHTPIDQVGINYTEHWRTETWQERVALGRALAPLKPWGEWGAKMNTGNPETLGGLSTLVLNEPFADRAGNRRAEIGPSRELADETRGVVLGVNYHRETEITEGEGALKAVSIIENEFESAISFAKKLVNDMRTFSEGLRR